jgi:ATP-dependent DNA helicase RecQ
MTNYDSARALALLRRGAGPPAAQFREQQELAIRHVVENRGRLLVVQKTGWGKSFVYFIATRLLREQGQGPALLISPLIALMRNQLEAAARMGVRAETIHSDNRDGWAAIEGRVRDDLVDVLLISPERLANERFQSEVLAEIAGRVSLLVVDEAHCISDWGHDFRPHYRLIQRIARRLPPNLRLLATTATANDRVVADLQAVLGPGLHVLRGDLNRPSLRLQTARMRGQAERLAWLAENIPGLPGSGIVYTLTVRDANLVAAWLESRGIRAAAYTGETEDREPLEQALLTNEIKALVATTALGMGYDKPDLAFVIHYQTPGSVVAYYQQVGRAGRAIDAAYGILFGGEEDTDITEYFIQSAFPTRAEVAAVIGALEAHPDGLSVPSLLQRVNTTAGRIQKAVHLMSLESPAPIVKVGTRWQLTAAPLGEAFWQRAERLTALRREEQRQMQDYLDLREGHMEFLIRALDGELIPHHNGLPPLPTEVSDELVTAAVHFLRRTSIPIEPRKKWPTGGMPIFGVQGLIPEASRAQEGRALSVWGDAGWGRLVRKGKYGDGRLSEELVEACAEMIDRWSPEPVPTWVTCITSRRHPELVPDFAQRLARRIGLPFEPVLLKTDDRPEQKSMANSILQARNVDGAMAIAADTMPAGPAVLVDDMVDSRWTMTVAAWLLRTHGAGPVYPVALSWTGH